MWILRSGSLVMIPLGEEGEINLRESRGAAWWLQTAFPHHVHVIAFRIISLYHGGGGGVLANTLVP